MGEVKIDWNGFISVVLYSSSMFSDRNVLLGCVQFVQCTVKEELCPILNIVCNFSCKSSYQRNKRDFDG